MSSFTKPLSITKVQTKKRKLFSFLSKEKFVYVDMWRVNESFEYHLGQKDGIESIKVPIGFLSDGASIPKFLWGVVGHPMQKYAQIAFVHDLLYTPKYWNLYRYSRKKCDRIFLEGMKVLNVPKAKRIIMYSAVRTFGGLLWKKRNVKGRS